MPGSTFKVLTTGIAFENGKVTLDSQFAERAPSGCRRRPPTRSRTSAASAAAATMIEVFTAAATSPSPSWPSTSAGDAMVKGVADVGRRRGGADRPARARLPARSARSSTSQQNIPLLAIGGFGQDEDQMVPLHMAMVASTVANGGADDEAVRRRGDARPRRQRARQHHAERVEDADHARRRPPRCTGLMISVAERGTASCCMPSTTASRRPPRPAPPSSTAPASRSARTPGSSPSPPPRRRATPSP